MGRVLLVGKGAPEVGGIPVFLDMLATSSIAERHRVELLNLAHGGTPEGGQVSWGNVRRTLHDVLAVRRRARGVDVVHVHSALAPAVTLIRAALLCAAGRLAGARVVLHVHGGRFQLSAASTVGDCVARFLLSSVDHAIAVSAEGRDRLARILGADRVTLVLNGIDTRAFHPSDAPDGLLRILHVGILTPRKGVADLIAASEELRQRGIAHELRLVGGTPDEGLAAELEVRGQAGPEVVFAGERNRQEMPEEYSRAHIFCLASWWEATPLTILEAMASGLPVVATDIGGIPDLVVPGETGVLVPPRSPRLLADALEELLLDPAARRELGDRARRRAVDEFDLTRVIAQVEEIYGMTGTES